MKGTKSFNKLVVLTMVLSVVLVACSSADELQNTHIVSLSTTNSRAVEEGTDTLPSNHDSWHATDLTGTVAAKNPDTWTVDGQTVVENDATEIDHAIPLGSLVKIEGQIASDGTLTAQAIELANTSELHVNASGGDDDGITNGDDNSKDDEDDLGNVNDDYDDDDNYYDDDSNDDDVDDGMNDDYDDDDNYYDENSNDNDDQDNNMNDDNDSDDDDDDDGSINDDNSGSDDDYSGDGNTNGDNSGSDGDRHDDNLNGDDGSNNDGHGDDD